MTLLEALFLGVVQGLTEFLPISSSGHLRLLAAVFGAEEPQTLFDICVHAGTLAAVIGFYRREVVRILIALPSLSWQNPDFRLGMLVLIGTVPAAVIGVSLGDLMEANLASVATVGGFLLLNGCVLMLARNAPATGRGLSELTIRDAILIGLAQSVALFRGISRSGSTIVAGLRLGISREAAAAFSFLLSIPAIGGAFLLEFQRAVSEGGVNPAPLVVGTVAAAISGYAALVLLLRLVRRGQLHHFAWYCWLLGGAAVVWTVVSQAG